MQIMPIKYPFNHLNNRNIMYAWIAFSHINVLLLKFTRSVLTKMAVLIK
jgi:hypothetical protein